MFYYDNIIPNSIKVASFISIYPAILRENTLFMTNNSPIQLIEHDLFKQRQITVQIKRDDLIHPIISGNKWRKLKYNLIHAKKNNKTSVLSFGGAYSNHIHALAFACYQQGLTSLGIIRGEAHYANNFTLTWAQRWGMKLIFVDRKTYKKRNQQDYLQQLQAQFPQSFIVPEGGSNELALPGMSEVIDELNQQTQFDSLLCPVGSGGTLAGLIMGDKNQHNLLGIAVLKQGMANKHYLEDEVKALLPASAKHYDNWRIEGNMHRGGYGKFTLQDLQRILAFSQQTNIPFEPIYSGKMVLALLDLIEQDYFPAGHKIVMLHTGGLQGLGGLSERQLINAKQWNLPPKAPNN